jgi:predicted nucleotide-binding protein
MAYIDVNLLESYYNDISANDINDWTPQEFEGIVDEISEYLASTLGEIEKRKFLNLLIRNDYGYNKSESVPKIKEYLTTLITQSQSQEMVVTKLPILKQLSTKLRAEPWLKTEYNNLQTSSKKNNSERPTVFIVHGNDNEAKETVARFVEKLELHVVILHEQPSRGRTIIEKFEDFAEKVAFAVVLLTPDDIATSRNNTKSYKFRARQNVIYELGFFNAKLGRHRVCALCKNDPKGDFELPSDFLGVVYVPLDSAGAWKMQLAKEMREAGLKINLESAF